MPPAHDCLFETGPSPRWIGSVPGRFMAVLLGGLLPAAATPLGAKESEPIRYFQFKFKPDQPAESLQNYLTFVQKNAPGIEGLRTQYAVADAFMAQGKWDEAAEILQTIVQVPQADEFFRASVLIKLADCNMRMAQFATASGYYTAAAQSAVRSILPEATIGLALACVAKGEREKAFVHFQELIAFYPSYKIHPRYMFPLGLIQWEVRKYEGALDYFLKDEGNPASLYFAGLCFRELKRVPEATAVFRRITEDHPESVWANRARFEVGETFYQQKDFNLAAQTFQNIYRDRPSDQWETLAYYRMACVDMQQNNFKAAEEKLTILADDNKDPMLLSNITYLLSEALAEQKKVTHLIDILESAQKTKRKSVDNMYRLIWGYTAQGDYKKAIDLANDFLSTQLDADLTPRALLVQGYAFNKLGKLPEAFASYQLVVENFPATPYAAKATQLAAMNYYRAGQFKAVTTQVNSLWESIDNGVRNHYPETLYWLAQAHLKLRHGDESEALFKEFAKIAPPRHPWLPQALRAQALASALGKSSETALPILQRAYQNASDIGDRALMGKLTLDMANISFNAKKYEKAAGFYRQMEQVDPKNEKLPFALFQGGVALYRSSYYTDAIDNWTKLVRQFPKDNRAPDALFRASKTWFDLAKFSEAIAGFEDLMRNYPLTEFAKDALLQIGQAYYNDKNFSKAIDTYKDFLAKYPRDPQSVQVAQLLQMAYYKTGKSPEDIDALTKGQTKNPVLVDVYWEEGAKLYNEKDYPKARELFEKIIFNFPTSSLAPQASFYRSEALFLEEKYQEAAVAYEGFLQSYKDDAQRNLAMFHLAVSRYNLKQFPESAQTFELFAQTFPKDALAQNASLNAALSYIQAQNVEEAIDAVQSYAASFPNAEDLGTAYLQLGQFLEKLGQEQKAAEIYRQTPPRRAEYPEALYNVARVFREIKNAPEEQKAYESLAALPNKSDPYRIAGLLQWGDLLVLQGKLPQAAGAYKDVVKNAADAESRGRAQEQLTALGPAAK